MRCFLSNSVKGEPVHCPRCTWKKSSPVISTTEITDYGNRIRVPTQTLNFEKHNMRIDLSFITNFFHAHQFIFIKLPLNFIQRGKINSTRSNVVPIQIPTFGRIKRSVGRQVFNLLEIFLTPAFLNSTTIIHFFGWINKSSKWQALEKVK